MGDNTLIFHSSSESTLFSNSWWILRDRDRDILARLRFGHQRPLNRRCPDEKYQYVNNNRLTEYPGTPAWTPATSKSRVSNKALDTRDLLVAGVPISISSKYLYLYLALKLLTNSWGESRSALSRFSSVCMDHTAW